MLHRADDCYLYTDCLDAVADDFAAAYAANRAGLCPSCVITAWHIAHPDTAPGPAARLDIIRNHRMLVHHPQHAGACPNIRPGDDTAPDAAAYALAHASRKCGACFELTGVTLDRPATAADCRRWAQHWRNGAVAGRDDIARLDANLDAWTRAGAGDGDAIASLRAAATDIARAYQDDASFAGYVHTSMAAAQIAALDAVGLACRCVIANGAIAMATAEGAAGIPIALDAAGRLQYRFGAKPC